MKRITLAVLAAVGLVGATTAFAADNGWYVGVDAGSASVGSTFARASMSSTTNTVGGVQLGYQFNKNWGAEIFYTGGGKFISSFSGNTANGKSDVWGVSAIGTMPLSEAFSLYARLGVASSNTSVSNSLAIATITGQSRTAATYGLGLQYNVTPAVGVRVGVDSYALATANGGGVIGATDNINSTVTSLGAVFKF
jgi:OOP family OmpA-OmpF porin